MTNDSKSLILESTEIFTLFSGYLEMNACYSMKYFYVYLYQLMLISKLICKILHNYSSYNTKIIILKY